MSLNITALRMKHVVGAAAGNVAVAGITPNDKILFVLEVDITLTEGAPNTRTWVPADRTAEFKITANDTINNTGGTSTLNKLLLVVWAAANPRGAALR